MKNKNTNEKNMNGFVHLHVHTEYSLLDGACRIKDLPKAVKKHGQSAVAITDHGNMFGVIDFYLACKKENVKPIIGCEVYVAKRTRFDKVHSEDSDIGHLVLLAENDIGYKNLIFLVSAAYTEGFYSKPRIDLDILKDHSEGIIALSACLAGFTQQYLLQNDFESAKNYALTLKEIFGENNFFLELQNHEIPDQLIVNGRMSKLAQTAGIGLVATNDVHYINKDDAEAQAIMICIQTAKLIGDGNPIGFETSEFYLKSTEQMAELFGEYENALENTLKIAERCNVEFSFENTLLPEYKVPGGLTPEEYLTKLSYDGFDKYWINVGRGQAPPYDYDLYKTRLDYELNIIISMGYAAYYLIVWDFINHAKNINIPIGPGRGSGAGSLVAFFIGITGIDPIKYNLLFERFLNPERISMPDFDIDICQDRRGEVMDYVIQKYGEINTAHIITFGTMAAKGVVRDVGRVLNMSYGDVDAIAKMIPKTLNMTLEKALEITPELKSRYESDDKVKNLIDMAMKLEGMPRHSSTHAAGLVITNKPVYEYVPLALSSGERVTQFTMNTVADLGLLKIDLLGLRYLTIIENTIKEIKKSEKNKDFDIEKIDLADPEIYKLYASGNNNGIFQFEASWIKSLMIASKPEYFEDLVALNALIRPGPMASIPTYTRNRHNKDLITYIVPQLKDILEVTYGCILYQEQVMQIFRTLAGYSYAQADLVRRAMAKKKAEIMEKERENFFIGCEKNGIDPNAASEIFDIMAEFANYAFPKAHAAAYAFISYRTAYLKYYYKAEFLCALMTSVLNDTAKLTKYSDECARLNITIYPPDINFSESDFTINLSDEGIRYGLLAIKNVGIGFLKNILFERETNGKFKSFVNFLTRMANYEQLNKRQVEALIKCGVFDNLGVYRSKLLAKYENIIDSLLNEKKSNIDGQIDLFGFDGEDEKVEEFDDSSVIYPDIPEMSLYEKLSLEKEAAGRFFSGHPLDDYIDSIKKLNSLSIASVLEFFEEAQEDQNDDTVDAVPDIPQTSAAEREDKFVTVAGIINEVNVKRTRNGENMAFLTFEDEYSSIEVVVFAKKYKQFFDEIKIDNIIAIQGNISPGREENPKILLNNIIKLKKGGDNSQIRQSNQLNPEMRTDDASQMLKTNISHETNYIINDNGFDEISILYLKVPDTECLAYKKTVNLIKIFDGKTEIKIYDENTKKIYSIKNPGTNLDQIFLDELKMLLGDENVKIVKKSKNI